MTLLSTELAAWQEVRPTTDMNSRLSRLLLDSGGDVIIDMANKTCQVCFANQATHFCHCRDPPTLFCHDCSSRHSGKDPLIIHQTIPVTALGRNKDYKRKHKALMKAAAQLRKNLELIDQFCHEFDDLIKVCTSYLTDYRSWWMQHMQTKKEELSTAIEAAVLEATTCLDQNQEPSSPLAWALWTLLPQDMQVVSCSVTAPDLQTILQSCVSYQNRLPALCKRSKPVEEAKQDSAPTFSSGVVVPLQDYCGVRSAHAEEVHYSPSACSLFKDTCASELVCVTNTFLCFFSCNASTWGTQVRLKTQIQADVRSRWVVLEDGRVFCCGGWGTAVAYILTRDGSVEQKANMSVERGGHGLLEAKLPYVFGGTNSHFQPIKTCEKLEFSKNEWSLLPSMRQARWFFNPCMLLGIVYLCGCGSMEAFVPQTDTFLPLDIPLPEDYPHCLYVDNHLLVLHSNTYIVQFAVQPDGQLVQHREVRAPQDINKSQNSQPLVHKEKGSFYIISEGECISFNMETGVQGPTVALRC